MFRKIALCLSLIVFAAVNVVAQESRAASTTSETTPAKQDEKQTAATSSFVPEVPSATATTASPSTPPTSDNPFKSLNWTIIADGYYTYNFNRPDDNVNAGFYMEPRHNRPTLNMVKLNLEKQSTLDSPFGFRVDAIGGPSNQLLLGTKDRARDLEATRFLWQAYVSYTAPIGNGLTLDFGKFATPIGMEVVDTKDNINYSHSYLFSYGPFYHTGLRGKYAFSETVSVTGYLVNAWDSLGDTNSGKTFGATVSVAPHKKFNFSQTYLTGPENPRDSDNWRNLFNTLVTYLPTDKLTLMGDFVYGNDRLTLATQRGHWTGFAGYAKYALTERLALGGRFDIFRDEDGLWTGLQQTLHGYTVTQEVKMPHNLITKFEFRRGVSNQDFFTRSQNRLTKNQNVALVGLTWFVTNKK